MFDNYLIFSYRKNLSEDVSVTIEVQHPDLVSVNTSSIYITKNDTKKKWDILINGRSAGHSIISLNVTPNNVTE